MRTCIPYNLRVTTATLAIMAKTSATTTVTDIAAAVVAAAARQLTTIDYYRAQPKDDLFTW